MTLRAGVVTQFPEFIQSALQVGITGRAIRDGAVSCVTVNPRDYATDTRKTIDDRPFGGGPGMVMLAQPLINAINDASDMLPDGAPAVFLSPQGIPFNQAVAQELASLPGLLLVAGRYEGVDERVLTAAVDYELSVGDYVVSGGELPALVVLDAIVRLLPGALGNPESATEESFVDGILDFPHYTRPETLSGDQVPAILLSGDHGAVATWRRRAAVGRTWERRPELLLDRDLTAADRSLLADYIRRSRTGRLQAAPVLGVAPADGSLAGVERAEGS